MLLTNEQINDLLELRDKSTKGAWHYNGNEIVSLDNPRVGIAGAMSEVDNQLISDAVNAVETIRHLQQQNKQLKQQNKQMEEALEQTKLFIMNDKPISAMKTIDNTLQSIQEGSSNA